jgi:antitoxin MazE
MPMMYLRVDTPMDPMPAKDLRLELTVAKWGNSLAVRLPVEAARKLGVGEGDALAAEVSADGRLVLSRQGHRIGKPEVRRLREFLARQTETAPVVERMRRQTRY